MFNIRHVFFQRLQQDRILFNYLALLWNFLDHASFDLHLAGEKCTCGELKDIYIKYCEVILRYGGLVI